MTAAQHVANAIREAEAALSALSRFQPTHKAPEPGVGADPGCQSCRRITDARGRPYFSDSRTPTSTYCRRCEDWRRDTSKLPPLGILEAWRDGKRLTTAIVDRAERAEKDRTRRKKRKAS